MSGLEIDGPLDAVWEDGEWISWNWIGEQLCIQDLCRKFPNADPLVIEIFTELVDLAQTYRNHTNRHLNLFGELGELFAEIVLGLRRHKPGTPGSDGRIGNDFIEIKTISPLKAKNVVSVKRSGNFNKLAVVKISENYEFELRTIDRKQLGKGVGKYARVSWSIMNRVT